MKTSAFVKDNASGNVYFPVVGFDTETGSTVVNYTLHANVSGIVVPGAAAIYFTSRVPLSPLSRVSELVDKYGTPLSSHKFLYIGETKPEMDFTGRIIAWRYTLKDSLPRNAAVLVAELSAEPNSAFFDTNLGHP